MNGLDTEEPSGGSEASPEAIDDRYHEILDWILAQSEVSASLIQRRFQLGYPRAARLIELYESQGVVGPANGSKPRQVLKRSNLSL
jgi:S-DNA-T family DNA segregation ATPase FtsK/SpoIIIE